jgi:hypothetical protein
MLKNGFKKVWDAIYWPLDTLFVELPKETFWYLYAVTHKRSAEYSNLLVHRKKRNEEKKKRKARIAFLKNILYPAIKRVAKRGEREHSFSTEDREGVSFYVERLKRKNYCTTTEYDKYSKTYTITCKW